MKITSGIQQQFMNLAGYGAHPVEEKSGEFANFLKEPEGAEAAAKAEAGAKILSLREKNTLHALFGTEKPVEFEVYNRSGIQNIHKGQLLDIRG